jgi:hypothetical protein
VGLQLCRRDIAYKTIQQPFEQGLGFFYLDEVFFVRWESVATYSPKGVARADTLQS